jgi:hypothetical protein
MGVTDYVHLRKACKGVHPVITTPEVDTPLDIEIHDEDSKLKPPAKNPNNKTQAKIIAEAIAKAVKVAMTNFTYKFNGVTRLQSQGGPMGNQLSGAVARAEMMEMDTAILNLCGANKMLLYMYKRFVDDQVGAYRAMAKGMKWDQTTRSVMFC